MHISDSRPRGAHQQAKCTKMTEETTTTTRLYGMNGNAANEKTLECHTKSTANYAGQGGRLKFFKDGKFILELERAREGERVSWVSVHRKTFWPPQGTASTIIPSYKQESSTSLSVSDDNSSIQSSPWQRDHSWKQTNPKKNLSKELTFYFYKPKSNRTRKRSRKCRTPYSTVTEKENGDCVQIKKENAVKKENDCKTLLSIVQKLLDKGLRTNTPPRAESVVSPRKRFLREMERDKPQSDDNCHKKSRNKPQVTAPISNGIDETVPKPATPRNSNYSITSLLSDERRSPAIQLPHHLYSDDRWYSESVDKLRSIELSHAEKCGYPSAYHATSPYLGHYTPYPYPPPYYGGYVLPSTAYHGSPMPVPIRDGASCSWGEQPSSSVEGDHREDSISDMPLNLSKHSG